jgi:phytol kinase
MIATASVLWQHPWAGIALAATSFGALVAALTWYSVGASTPPETRRKLLHVGSGLLTLPFPFLFADLWPVLLLTGSTVLFLAGVKFLRPGRRRFGNILPAVGRTTFGELYFPAAVALVFWLSLGEHPIMFVVPVLVLSFADAGSAVIGKRYGTTRYGSANKTIEGSLAFAVVAFACIYVPLLVWHPSTSSGHPSTSSGQGAGQIEAVLIAVTLALAVTLIEGVARRGRDNLFIPIGTYFILAALLDLDTRGLQLWLVIALALVCFIVMRIGSTQPAVDRHPNARIRVDWPAGRSVRRKRSWA